MKIFFLMLLAALVFGCSDSKHDTAELKISYSLEEGRTCQTYLADHFLVTVYDSSQRKISEKKIMCDSEEEGMKLVVEKDSYYVSVVLLNKDNWWQSYGAAKAEVSGDTEINVAMEAYQGGMIFEWDVLVEITGLFVGFSLEREVHPRAGHCLVEIDFVAVEIGSVDTCKACDALAFMIQCKAAASAHSCTIDHDRVHGNGYRHSEGLGRERDELHHDQRSDGDYLIEAASGLEHLLQGNGHVAVAGIGTVVCHYYQFVGSGTELVLENQKILVSETDDAGDVAALGLESLGYGKRNCASHSSAYYADVFLAFDLGGLSKRSHEILDGLAFLLVIQLLGGGTDNLEDYLDRAGLFVRSGNGKGDSLSVLIYTENDELSRLGLCSHQRCLDFHLCDSRIQFFPA